MDRLQQGVRRFRAEEFEAKRELFVELESGQQPHTLFIGCSDSRVVPTLITDSGPGELFMVRNVANIVPTYGSGVADGGSAAAIEFAVGVLNVGSIVVCGHSGCGGCEALDRPVAELADLPHVRNWLSHSGAVAERVEALMASGTAPDSDRPRLFEQINVIVQLENLRTHPRVAAGLAAGSLGLQGWHYDIGTGEVLVLDEASGRFGKMEP